jgi:peptide/nickel transport system ATP-binding protein
MLLEVKNLRIARMDGFELVKGIDFYIQKGEWFSLIGESGSGKSLSAFSVGGLLPGNLRCTADMFAFLGVDLRNMPEDRYRKIRGSKISYVFQDYQGAFTPYYKLGYQMDEVMLTHTDWTEEKRVQNACDALENVGLDGYEVRNRYPFQVSGGQLQRVALAIAMLLEPSLLIADEPTTALDAMNAALVLELIAKLQRERNCSILFITHDLRTVRKYADRIAIMQTGRIVESGEKTRILKNPREPYTRNLLASIPPLRDVPDRLPVREETAAA